MMAPGLLGQHAESGVGEDRHSGRVGHHIRSVLARPRAGRAPPGEPVERGAHGGRGIGEHVEQCTVVQGARR